MNEQEQTKTVEEEESSDKTFRSSMLSTVDNPFNPFTNFEEWKTFDESKSYFTCNYLARMVVTSDDLSGVDESLAIEDAIDRIVKQNVLGIYIKVREP